jgi:hypothetical protein
MPNLAVKLLAEDPHVPMSRNGYTNESVVLQYIDGPIGEGTVIGNVLQDIHQQDTIAVVRCVTELGDIGTMQGNRTVWEALTFDTVATRYSRFIEIVAIPSHIFLNLGQFEQVYA